MGGPLEEIQQTQVMGKGFKTSVSTMLTSAVVELTAGLPNRRIVHITAVNTIAVSHLAAFDVAAGYVLKAGIEYRYRVNPAIIIYGKAVTDPTRVDIVEFS